LKGIKRRMLFMHDFTLPIFVVGNVEFAFILLNMGSW